MAFAKVPRDVLQAIQHNQALSGETRALAALLDAQYGWNRDKGRPVAFSYDRIAFHVGLKKRQTIEVVRKLMEAGAIDVERTRGRLPNHYRLSVHGPSPNGAVMSAPLEGDGPSNGATPPELEDRTVEKEPTVQTSSHRNGADMTARFPLTTPSNRQELSQAERLQSTEKEGLIAAPPFQPPLPRQLSPESRPVSEMELRQVEGWIRDGMADKVGERYRHLIPIAMERISQGGRA